jgi:hypothetical protein
MTIPAIAPLDRPLRSRADEEGESPPGMRTGVMVTVCVTTEPDRVMVLVWMTGVTSSDEVDVDDVVELDGGWLDEDGGGGGSDEVGVYMKHDVSAWLHKTISVTKVCSSDDR